MAARTGSPNRLIHETSPYLLQHAHNPVEWYPWGAEALERSAPLHFWVSGGGLSISGDGPQHLGLGLRLRLSDGDQGQNCDEGK